MEVLCPRCDSRSLGMHTESLPGCFGCILRARSRSRSRARAGKVRCPGTNLRSTPSLAWSRGLCPPGHSRSHGKRLAPLPGCIGCLLQSVCCMILWVCLLNLQTFSPGELPSSKSRGSRRHLITKFTNPGSIVHFKARHCNSTNMARDG